MGCLLQGIHCDQCKRSYLVGINHKDVRKVEGTSGQLGTSPWVAFGHEQTERCPEIKGGDVIPCPNCNVDCIVEDLYPKGDNDGNEE